MAKYSLRKSLGLSDKKEEKKADKREEKITHSGSDCADEIRFSEIAVVGSGGTNGDVAFGIVE